MAQQDRVTIQGLINLYITTNGNKEITGAQLKEILTNLNDSAFLQLDELRTALSTSYNPANPSDWNVLPTEVKAALDEAISRVEGLENAGFQTAIQTPYTRTVPSDWDGTPNELQSSTDELAARMRIFETNNFSQDVAFVSNDGSDVVGEYEVGNPAKPFATIQAAIDAVPTSNSSVYVLGGTYSGTISLSSTSAKTNFSLIMRGITLTGNITMSSSTSNILIDAQGSTISTSSATVLEANGTDCIISGGVWNATSTNIVVVAANGCIFQNCKFQNTSTGRCAFAVDDSRVLNCIFISQSNDTLYRCNNNFFDSCLITRVDGGQAVRTQNEPNLYRNCSFFGFITTEVGLGLKGRWENCRMESSTFAIKFQGDANVFLKDCILIGGTYAVDLTVASGTLQSWLQNCMLYGVTDIFNEPATYTVTGKKVYSIKCIYDKNFTPNTTNEQRVFEFDKTEITDIVAPAALTF